MRERQYLKRAGRNRDGHLPPEVSMRLVEAMLAEEWIYREDGDGYRLEPAEALVFRGDTAWRITERGRWSALAVRQRKLLAELGERPLALARGDGRVTALVEVGLAEGVGGVLRLTLLGRRVRDLGRRLGAGIP